MPLKQGETLQITVTAPSGEPRPTGAALAAAFEKSEAIEIGERLWLVTRIDRPNFGVESFTLLDNGPRR